MCTTGNWDLGQSVTTIDRQGAAIKNSCEIKFMNRQFSFLFPNKNILGGLSLSFPDGIMLSYG